VRILWDEPKRRKVLAERGLDFADVTIEFLLEEATAVASKHGRLLVVGTLKGKPVAVIYSRLGTEALSIVTMRPPSRKERKLL
jgi:uncharacterized DUF497 family protein